MLKRPPDADMDDHSARLLIEQNERERLVVERQKEEIKFYSEQQEKKLREEF